MRGARCLAAIALATCLGSVAALGFQPMSATLRVSSGSLYDYVVLGEHPKATDGFDNAYDTVSPGNLNADMGEPFISVVLPRPEFKPAFRELRGDLRSPSRSQQWQLALRSSLPKGTPLTLALQDEGRSLPAGMTLTVREGTGKGTDLTSGNYPLLAPGPGRSTTLLVSAEQPY